jgi:hypothetical protein
VTEVFQLGQASPYLMDYVKVLYRTSDKCTFAAKVAASHTGLIRAIGAVISATEYTTIESYADGQDTAPTADKFGSQYKVNVRVTLNSSGLYEAVIV